MDGNGRILVIKPSSLGDVVHTFPALELLRRSFPQAELDFVIHPALAELLDLSPFPVRKKILFDRRELGSFAGCLPELVKLIREIRREKYMLTVDFQGLFRSGFLSWCSRSPVIAGFASPREQSAAGFYNHKVDVCMEQHAVSRNAELVNKLCGTSYPVPAVEIPGDICGLPPLPRHFAALVPGARWKSKTFPAQLFGRIMEEARKKAPGCAAVIVGGPGDAPCAAEIRKIIPDALDLTGKTSLVQLVAVMARARAVLTNDSGPMHIGALANSPVFALFGPTLPKLTGPYGTGHRIFKCEDLECCGCMNRICPLGEPPLCHNIDPVSVGEELGELLKQKILEVSQNE